MMARPSDSNNVFPRCACYNIRFLGHSNPGILQNKLANVRALCIHNEIVALSEVHASSAVAQATFF